ncbi:hypothetical protein K474DRAFT_1666333, partial [Panus rudis PR-1116 ss-1]
TYVGLLWDSRNVACLARTHADELTGDLMIFLGQENSPLEEKRKVISDFIEKLSHDEVPSQKMIEGTQNLKNDIHRFQDKWDTIVNNHSLAIGADIGECIKEVNVSLQQADDKFSTLVPRFHIFELITTNVCSFGFVPLLPRLEALNRPW